jgi:hypothetical protein
MRHISGIEKHDPSFPGDNAWREYGATPAELERFEKRMEQQISAERKRGKIKRFSGNLDKNLAG